MPSISTMAAEAGRRLAQEGVAYAGAIASAAVHHGLDPKLLAAVAAQETGGPGSNAGRNILGDGGHGHGLFQIDDRWHGFARTAAAMNPAKNAEYAATMIAGLIKQYGDVRKALCAYNAGSPSASGTTTQWADGKQLGYADSVLRHYAQLGGASAQVAAQPPSPLPAQSERQNAIAEIFAEIAQMNQLQSRAQSAPAASTQSDISFAGVLDAGDDSN